MGNTPKGNLVILEDVPETVINRARVQEFIGFFDEHSKVQLRMVFQRLEKNLWALEHLHSRVGNLQLAFLTTHKLVDPLQSILTTKALVDAALGKSADGQVKTLLKQRKLLLYLLKSNVIPGAINRAIHKFIRVNDCHVGTNFTALTYLRTGLQKDRDAQAAFSPDGVNLICDLLNQEARKIISKHKAVRTV